MHATFCPLADIGVFEITGTDALAFLHGQLSVDLTALDGTSAPLAAWSAANGRVRALVRVVPGESGYTLLAPAAMTETLLNKLGMFVLRADVTIRPSETLALGAVLDATPDWLEARGVPAAVERDRVERAGALTWIAVGPRLRYALGPEPELAALASAAAAGAPAAVELAEIEQGLPRIEPATAEQFLPQMLDLDRLGGVAFDKGCYPGQEVIARTQNLGTVKRRPRRFGVAGAAAPEPGTPLRTPDGTEAGLTLRAAHEAGRTELLAVVRLEALSGPLHVGTADGPALTELPFEPPRAAPNPAAPT